MRRSRRIRSNRRRSRRVYPNTVHYKAIGESFATKQRTPLMGRIKRVFDLPSQPWYYGENAYPAKFGTVTKAEADQYAEKFGVDPESVRGGRALAQNRRRSYRVRPNSRRRSSRRRMILIPNTLIAGVGRKAANKKLGKEMYQLVETTEGSRMWRSSYPITVAGYMVQGYLRDFKLGGIAKRKAKMAPGTRIKGGTKRKDARDIPDTE